LFLHFLKQNQAGYLNQKVSGNIKIYKSYCI